MPRFLVVALALAASTASAVTFTTHFPLTRGTPTYAASPSSASVVYAVSAGTLYRSNDGGASFETRGSVVGTSVQVDPTNADIVYDVAGFHRSDDGGATWTPFGGEVGGVRIAFDPANPAELRLFGFCSSFRPALAGVFISHDRGNTWQHDTSTCTLDIAFDPLPPYTEYRATLLGGSGGLPTRQVVADARAPRVRYGLATAQYNSVLFSDDFGATWRTFGASPPVGNINVLALDDTRLFAGTSAGLFVSENGVPSWHQVPAAPGGPVFGLTIAGDLLYVATANGLYHAPLATLDPFTPAATLPPIPVAVRGLAADPHAPRVYATAQVIDVDGTPLGNVWRSDDGGGHWQSLGGSAIIPRGAIAVDGAGDVYAFDFTTIGGETPTNLFHYDGATGKTEEFSTDIALEIQRVLWADPHRRGVLYTNKNGLLYRSGDGGHSWQIVSSLNDGTKWIALASIAFDPNRAGVIYAATDDGLFRTLDDGATWSLLDTTATSRIAIAPSRSVTIYRIGTTFSRSDDSGATWTPLPPPPGGGHLTVDPLNDRSVWGSSDRNLCHSIDGGATWSLDASFAALIDDIAIESDGVHLHVALAPDAAPGEWDATIRSPRRRAMLSP